MINKTGNKHSEILDKVAQVVPDDGFVDGGESYTDKEKGTLDKSRLENIEQIISRIEDISVETDDQEKLRANAIGKLINLKSLLQGWRIF